LREELAKKDTAKDRRSEILRKIIKLEELQTESVHGGLVAQEHMHYSGGTEPADPQDINYIAEKDIIDLIEEKLQLENAIETCMEALEKLKQEDPANFEEFKKINGLLRGSVGMLELVKAEMAERERLGEAA
jgi:hypothetical protein